MRNNSLSSFFNNADMYTRFAVVSAMNYIKFLIEEQGFSPIYVYRRYNRFVELAIENAEVYAELPEDVKQLIRSMLLKQRKMVLWYWVKRHVKRLRYLIWKYFVMEVLSIAYWLRC